MKGKIRCCKSISLYTGVCLRMEEENSLFRSVSGAGMLVIQRDPVYPSVESG